MGTPPAQHNVLQLRHTPRPFQRNRKSRSTPHPEILQPCARGQWKRPRLSSTARSSSSSIVVDWLACWWPMTSIGLVTGTNSTLLLGTGLSYYCPGNEKEDRSLTASSGDIRSGVRFSPLCLGSYGLLIGGVVAVAGRDVAMVIIYQVFFESQYQRSRFLCMNKPQNVALLSRSRNIEQTSQIRRHIQQIQDADPR